MAEKYIENVQIWDGADATDGSSPLCVNTDALEYIGWWQSRRRDRKVVEREYLDVSDLVYYYGLLLAI